MAEQVQTNSSTFPNPPDFLWREFTPDKLSRFGEASKAWQDENPEAAAASSRTVTLIPNLPEDLRLLQPPPEPAEGTFRALGGHWTLKDELPTLEEVGLQRLSPTATNGNSNSNGNGNGAAPLGDSNRERALNLKRLTKSVLLNFLEFVGVASINPDGAAEKANDIEIILINIHNAINEYRPHQARESLVQSMQDRLDQVRNETAAVNAVTDKAKRVLEGLGSIEASSAHGGQEGVKGGGGGGHSLQNGVTGPSDRLEDQDIEVWSEAAEFA